MFQNKYLIIIVCIISLLTSSCKDSISIKNSEQNEVLLSNLSLPKNYKLLYKYKYYPEGEISNIKDSIYVFKNNESNVEITIKNFNKDYLENVDDRINSFKEMTHYENNSFNIKAKKIDKELGIWFIKYTFGTKGDFIHNLYMERHTAKYRITVKSFDFDMSLKDIGYLYKQIAKFPYVPNESFRALKKLNNV